MRTLKMLGASLLMLSCIQLVALVGPTATVAQETEEQPEEAEEQPEAEEQEEDNTGTNPINFTYDARFYPEMSWLPEGGSLITTTFEFRAPLGADLQNLTNERIGIFDDLGKRFAYRIKVRQKSLNLEDEEGRTETISGIGDTDFRLLGIPYVTNTFGIAGGLEWYFPTATNDFLGDGRFALVPQIFFGFFGLLGPNSIFAPGYLYVWDIGGDSDRNEVNQHKIDMYFVWLLAQMRHWLIVNPQANFDVGNDRNLFLVDVEWGFMIPPLPGASVYLRPGVGIGSDRPWDATFEFGFKFIWR